jgi:hypothetical protein
VSGYVSKDGHWHLSVISIDGRQVIRVEHDTVKLPDGHTVPVHQDAAKRAGIDRTAHGWLVADVASVADAARYVDLSTLQEAP